MNYNLITKTIKSGTENAFGVARVFSLKEFLEMYHLRKISPADGYVMGITINRKLTNLYLVEWQEHPSCPADSRITLKELEIEEPHPCGIWWKSK